MKYTTHLVEDQENNFYHVVYEHATEQVIDYFFFEDDAVDYAIFLNKGGAFDGFTPAYILKDYPVPKDKASINKKFENIISA
jgi:hypothetical protein